MKENCQIRGSLYLFLFKYQVNYSKLLAGLPGVARAFTTLKYYVYPSTPGALTKIITPPRPTPGHPRPTCKVSPLYLENRANALRQKDR